MKEWSPEDFHVARAAPCSIGLGSDEARGTNGKQPHELEQPWWPVMASAWQVVQNERHLENLDIFKAKPGLL